MPLFVFMVKMKKEGSMLMKGFAKTLGDVLSTIDGIVWGPIMLCLLVEPE